MAPRKPTSANPIPLPRLSKQLRESLSNIPSTDSSGHKKTIYRSNKSVDLLAMLNYKLFLRDLMREAEDLSKKDGSSKVYSWHLKEASTLILKKYRG